MESFEHRLLRFINDELLTPGAQVVDANTQLFASGLIGSLRLLDLLAFVEIQVGHEIEDEDIVLDRFATPRRISEYFDHA